MRKIFAFCNQKGGVGKTTTAINLAAYLAGAGKKILLIDIDPQGNATSGLSQESETRYPTTIYNVIMGEIAIGEAIISTQVRGLSLLPSGIELTGAEVELVGTIGREYKLRKALQNFPKGFDFTFIDCPPSLGLLTINALTASEAVIIPIQCEYYALEGLSQLLNTIKLVRDNLNPELCVEGVVLTMADYRTNLTREVIEEVRKFFKEKVYKSIIPRSVKLSEAPGFGKPIMLYDRHSVGARMYEGLSREFLGQRPLASDLEAQDATDEQGQMATQELPAVIDEAGAEKTELQERQNQTATEKTENHEESIK